MTGLDIGAAVPVLDLRGVTAAPAPDLALADRVVLVDSAAELESHADRYGEIAALRQLGAIILVLVGSADGADGVVVRQPAALSQIGATVWIGDPHGWLWSGDYGRGRPRLATPDEQPDGLADILGMLILTDVFDAVFARLREMPYQTACPGYAVAHLPAPDGLAATLDAVLRQLAGPDPADRAGADGALLPATPSPAGPLATVAPGSAIGQVRAAASERLSTLGRALPALRAPRGLLDGGRLATIWALVAGAGARLADHRDLVHGTARRIAGHLRTGVPSVGDLVAAGLPAPRPVDPVGLTGELRDGVRRTLDSGASLAALAARLRGDQPDPSTSDAPQYRAADVAAARLRQPAAFALWPSPMAGMLPVVLVSGLLAGWLSDSGLFAAVVAVLGWLAAGWLLLARRPTARGPAGLAGALDEPVPLAAVFGAAVFGAATGIALPPVLPGSLGLALAVLLLLLVVIGATTAVSWNLAVAAWTRALDLPGAFAAHQGLIALLDNEISTTWCDIGRYRRLADARVMLAAGVTEVGSVLTETARDLGPRGAGADGPEQDALRRVLRHDLTELGLRVLEPLFAQVEYGDPLAVQPSAVTGEARTRLGEYTAHLARAGVHVAPPGATNQRARHDLESAAWRRSSAGRQLLRIGEGAELAQLCRAGDLRLLNVDRASTFRFAPRSVQELARVETATTELVLTEGEAIGVLRLAPLRAGAVDTWVPVATDDEATIGNSGDWGRPA